MSPDSPSILRLAATTPARDWARLRLTGRLDWRAPIVASALPAPLADLVARVVRRSRLWRSEKADLARELCSHFTDGLAAGRTTEELAMHFGNPRDAARLVRRAKKRRRPLAYRAFVLSFQGLGAVLLAAALLYCALAWRFFTGKPDIKRNYTAEYNRTIEAIPEDQRAWPFYLQTYAMLDPVPKELERIWPAPAPTSALYPAALAYLESQQDVLELVHRIAGLPRLGAPFSDRADPRIVATDNARNPDAHSVVEEPSENPMLISVLLPTLGHMRSLARLLTFDAHVAADAGDADRVARDLRTMMAIARHAGDQPVLIASLVEFAIEHLASETAAEIINQRPGLLSDEQLRDLAHSFAGPGLGDITSGLKGERWMFEDTVQRIYTDDGHGNGFLTAEGLRMLAQTLGTDQMPEGLAVGPQLAGPVATLLVADRAALVAKYDELMTSLEAHAGKPLWEYDEFPSVTDSVESIASDPLERLRYLPIVILMPALDRASQTGQYLVQERDALLAGIAITLYQRDQGADPPSLDALVPKYLPSPPVDRFTGAPLHYDIKDGQPRLWSVGADRNDDHGRAPKNNNGRIRVWQTAAAAARNEAETPDLYDGDWTLWPVVYEPLTGETDEDQ